MFGTLKPHGCALPAGQRQQYDHFYCGVCQSIGESHGLLSRALLSHDAVFMGLLVDGLLPEAAAPDACRCPIMPLQIRKTVSPRSVAMRYATAVQMLLGDQLLADRAQEGRRLFRVARPLFAGHVARAQKTLRDLGLSMAPLDGFAEAQAGCEVLGETGVAAAAAQTASALAYIFGQLAALPAAGPELRAAATQETLQRLGAAIGRTIYCIDALEDLKKDFLGGSFNPCLERGAGGLLHISPSRVAACARLLRRDVASLRRLLAALPLLRHRDVLQNILCNRLAGQARRAIELAKQWAGGAGRLQLAALRALPLYGRALHGAAALWVWLWTTVVFMGSALAEKGRHFKHARHAAKELGKAAVATPAAPAAAPTVVPSAPAAAAVATTPSAGAATPATPSLPSGGSGGSRSSGSSSGTCSRCWDSSTDACCGWTKGCGDLCSGCSDTCGKCDCSDCGKCCDCADCNKCDCTHFKCSGAQECQTHLAQGAQSAQDTFGSGPPCQG